MDRKGISFTLTVVVAGVILLMTALSIITLGGSSLTNFFNTISNQQGDAVQEADIRQKCNELAQEIDREYCEMYVKTAEISHSEGSCDDGQLTEPGTAEDCDQDGGIETGPDGNMALDDGTDNDGDGRVDEDRAETDDTYSYNGVRGCSEGELQSNREVYAGNQEEGALYSELTSQGVSPGGSVEYHGQTASGVSPACNWNDNYFGITEGPTVTVDGNTYNCLQRGHITSETCPAQ